MTERARAKSGVVKASGEVNIAQATAALLRATVAAMHCREHLNEGRVAEATVELATMHDAVAELADAMLDDEHTDELVKLVSLERELALALRVPKRHPHSQR